MMSDVMLLGVLRMPIEYVGGPLSPMAQFVGRAREAADRIEADAAEIERLRKVWEDTRTQRDELLAHLTRKEPLPAWAVEWIRVYGA